MKHIKIYSLVISLLVCLSAGVIGSLFTYQAIPTWYATLVKPPFNPPNWVFGPVWTTLYIMMGISLYILWNKKSKKVEKKLGLRYFSVQLVLNALWSIVFFGLRSPLSAFFVIIALWVVLFLTTRSFYSVSRVASWLLIPYLLWVSFASLLNFAIVTLNR